MSDETNNTTDDLIYDLTIICLARCDDDIISEITDSLSDKDRHKILSLLMSSIKTRSKAGIKTSDSIIRGIQHVLENENDDV